jgi:hypothetical protein
MDMGEFIKNRQAFPMDELAKYMGKHVAWGDDGKRIVASAEDELQLDKAVLAAGYDPREVVFSYIPDGDIELGWAGMELTE